VSALETAGSMAGALQEFPLLAGIATSDVERLEHFMARFEIAAGERLFRQGDASGCMHLIDEGLVDVQVELTDGRTHSLAQVGPGEVLGEISLLGAGTRSATALALEPTSGWMLYRAAFETLRIDSHAGSVELMARIAELAVARLRARYEAIAAELGEPDVAAAAPPPQSVPVAPALYMPAYLHSLLCFRAFHDHEQVAAAIGAALPYEIPRGSSVPLPDGASADLLLVLRGAVDVSVRRGGTARRVRLAGPGRFVGHLGALDEGPSPVVAHARERVVLVALPGARVRAMLRDASAAARRLSAAITADTGRAIWQAERPIARTLTRP
jgi:CRP/FNR family transcriptional regulator, cyclic AMP receptor protein